jgi:hypothetical protein
MDLTFQHLVDVVKALQRAEHVVIFGDSMQRAQTSTECREARLNLELALSKLPVPLEV